MRMGEDVVGNERWEDVRREMLLMRCTVVPFAVKQISAKNTKGHPHRMSSPGIGCQILRNLTVHFLGGFIV
jgi:hypothetical protein